MASKAFQNFRDKNLKDVRKLLETHQAMSGKGRNALDHLTRSAILILAASWEIYLEDVIQESAHFYTNHLHSPRQLPDEVQMNLSKFVKSDKHKNNLKPLELAGHGWKDVYLELVEKETNGVNSPKSTVIAPLFKNLLGADDLVANWSAPEKVDKFVSDRGEIAHRVRPDYYVKVPEVQEHLELLFEEARLTENYLSDFMMRNLNLRPWKRVYS